MTPTIVAAHLGQRKVMARVAKMQWDAQRREDARKHGFTGALTRAEAARMPIPSAAVMRSRKVR